MATITRKAKTKGLKRLCIYIFEKSNDNGSIDTMIDHIGDEELLQVYKRNILEDALTKVIRDGRI